MTLINLALVIHVEHSYSESYLNDNLMPVRARLDERQAEIGSSITSRLVPGTLKLYYIMLHRNVRQLDVLPD